MYRLEGTASYRQRKLKNMLKFTYIILTIFISLLPNSNLKNSYYEKIAQKVATKLPEQKQPEELKLVNIPQRKAEYTIGTESSAALFVDVQSGEILFEKEKDKKLPIASTTKLMTALVAIDKLDLNEVITVPNYSLRPLDSAMGLTPGTKFKTSELLHGLLIDSAADAALTISAKLGGEHEFASLMNEKTKILGLKNTQFSNSVGYDDPGNYSTASDLVAIARIALSSPTISGIVSKPSYTVTDENGRKYFVSNTNKLLSNPNFKGIKTGTTIEAGQCLITLFDDGEREIIGVVLASPERFGDTQNIIEWTKQAFSW